MMTKKELWSTLKRKLLSRKFWLALSSFIVGLILLFTKNEELSNQIGGLIMSMASVLGYLLAEGLTDIAHSDVSS